MSISQHLGAVQRTVRAASRDGKAAHSVVLTRSFGAAAKELWPLLTEARHISRWLGAIEGRFELGGQFELKGNARGDILACRPPRQLEVTWEFAEESSWVEVKLQDGVIGGVRLSLEHTSVDSPHWSKYGPSAGGIGWEMALMALWMCSEYQERPLPDPVAWFASSEGRTFIVGSSEGWASAAAEAGADPVTASALAKRTAAFYLGEAS